MKARLLGARYFQIVVLTVLAGILYLGAHFFVETFRINRVWMERVEIPSALAFDANTFDFLSAGGAIWPVRDGVSVSLGHAPCNTLALRSPETVTLVSGPAGEDGRKYIRELCESAQGERIRQEVANFNQSYRIVAVSDNREAASALKSDDGVACADGVSNARLFVPPRCLPNKWDATIAADGRAVQSITAATISQFDYAFLASETKSFFGDWKVITPVIDTQTGESGQYRFTTSMAFGDLPVSIRTIGAVKSVSVNGTPLKIDTAVSADEVREAAGRAQLASLAIYCADDTRGIGHRVRCEGESPRGRPTGSLLLLSEPKGRVADVELVIEPSIRIDRGLRRYLAAGQNDISAADGKVSLGFGRIRVACDLSGFETGKSARGARDTGCELSWNVPDSQRVERQSEPLTGLALGDLPVLDSQGALTQKAFEIGLAPLLGLGTGDSGSVAAALTRTEAGENPSLTLVPDYQEKALAALSQNYRCPKDEERCSRRADLVILDAEGEDAGDVLAIASLPQPRTGMSSWDIETLELTASSKSPLAAYAWRNYDLRGTPGSSFKLITALAASQYVLDSGDAALEEVLLGRASPTRIADLFGIVATRPSFNGAASPITTNAIRRNSTRCRSSALVIASSSAWAIRLLLPACAAASATFTKPGLKAAAGIRPRSEVACAKPSSGHRTCISPASPCIWMPTSWSIRKPGSNTPGLFPICCWPGKRNGSFPPPAVPRRSHARARSTFSTSTIPPPVAAGQARSSSKPDCRCPRVNHDACGWPAAGSGSVSRPARCRWRRSRPRSRRAGSSGRTSCRRNSAGRPMIRRKASPC